MDRKVSAITCLTYMTTGYLLERLVASKSLSSYTHIIIDEVHERDEDTDLLLLIVRKFMRHTRCTTKVILMSATVDARKFAAYFEVAKGGVLQESPIVDVDVEKPYAITEYYLDNLKMNQVSILIWVLFCSLIIKTTT